MCVLVEGHCISDTVALQEMIATPAAKLPYDHHHHVQFDLFVNCVNQLTQNAIWTTVPVLSVFL